MTNSLADFQQDALQKLLDPACPHHVVVRSPVQAGIRRIIEAIIHQVAGVDRVLVLTSMRLMAEQWRDRLSVDNSIDVTLMSADIALGRLEHSDGRPAEVLVATYASAMRGPIRRVLAELNYGLIIYDDLGDVAVDRWRTLTAHARRVIVLSPIGRIDVPNWPVAVDITAADLEAAVGGTLVHEVLFRSSQAENNLQHGVARLLEEYTGNVAKPGDRINAGGVAALHTLLLDVVAALQETDDTGDEDRARRERLLKWAWSLVDQAESLPVVDSRLHALDRVLAGELANGSRCLIVATKLSDVSYIASHLANAGRPPAAVLTSNTGVDPRRELQLLGPGECIVAGASVAYLLDNVHTPYTLILWSGASLERIVDQIGGAKGIRILRLAEAKTPQ